MKQSPSSEVNWFFSMSRNSLQFMEPESSLPHLQEPDKLEQYCSYIDVNVVWN